jgi:hypothetical protein
MPMKIRYHSRVESTSARITATTIAVATETVAIRNNSAKNQFGIVCTVRPTLCATRYEANANGSAATVASAPSAAPNALRYTHGLRMRRRNVSRKRAEFPDCQSHQNATIGASAQPAKSKS